MKCTVKCSKCGKPAIITISYLGESYCEDCFSEYFEKKVLATLRGNLPSHGQVGFDTTALGGEVIMHIVKPYALKARNECIEITAITTEKLRNLDLILTGETLDDLNADTLAYLMGLKDRLEETNSIKPLAKCTDEEVRTYAKIKGIKFHKVKHPGKLAKLIREELDKLEKKHPGTKLSLLKTREYLLSLS